MDPVVVAIIGVISACCLLYVVVDRMGRKPAPAIELSWLVTPDDDREEFEPLVKDHTFMQRVASVIERKTQCQTATDRDLIRVYKKNKLVGIVKCCEVGRNATPAMVRTTVELAEHLKVKTMYLAIAGPAPLDTQRFAALQKVKLISV